MDQPKTKKMDQSLDKADIAKVFMPARSYKPPATHYPVTQEKVPLLEYDDEPHGMPVNEPEDDLPPPKYRDT